MPQKQRSCPAPLKRTVASLENWLGQTAYSFWRVMHVDNLSQYSFELPKSLVIAAVWSVIKPSWYPYTLCTVLGVHAIRPYHGFPLGCPELVTIFQKQHGQVHAIILSFYYLPNGQFIS